MPEVKKVLKKLNASIARAQEVRFKTTNKVPDSSKFGSFVIPDFIVGEKIKW